MTDKLAWVHKDADWKRENPGKPYIIKQLKSEAPKPTKQKVKSIAPDKQIIPEETFIEHRKLKKNKNYAKAGIYAIVCEVEKYAYVGQSINVATRLRNHRMEITKQHGNNNAYIKLKAHTAKHGIEALQFKLILEIPNSSLKQLLEEENNTMIQFIKQGYTLYNKTIGLENQSPIIYCPEDLKHLFTKLITKTSEDKQLINTLMALIN